jgi:hypothetical protein
MNAFELTAGFPASAGTLPSYYSLDLFVLVTPGKLYTAQFNTAKDQLHSLYEFTYRHDMDMEEYFQSLRDVFEKEEVFQKPHRREIFAFDHPYSTLVPEDIFEEKSMRDYLSLSFDLPGEQLVMSGQVKGTGLRNVFCVPTAGSGSILSRFPVAGIHHLATPLLSGLFHTLHRYPGEDTVFCHLRQDILDLAIFSSGRLRYYNSFSYNNKEEFVYYILFVLEQLSMTSSSQQVIVMGEVEKRSEFLEYSRPYLGGIIMGGLPIRKENILTSPVPDIREYFTLLSLRLCA